MGSTIWKGRIVFGDFGVPIKLSSAARAESLSFNQLHSPDMSRLKSTLFCAAEDKAIARTEVVSGFEFEKDRYVVISDADIEAAKPAATRDRIDLIEFLDDLDPFYYESHYHVSPGDADEAGYAALYSSLKKTRLIGIGKVMMHRKESVAAVRAGQHGIMLHTLYGAEEVRRLAEFRTREDQASISQVRRLCSIMREQRSHDFDPFKFTDDFRVNLLKTIHDKISQAVALQKKPAGKEGKGSSRAVRPA